MTGFIPLLPLYAFTTWTGITLLYRSVSCDFQVIKDFYVTSLEKFCAMFSIGCVF
jgi:hypothetical protein